MAKQGKTIDNVIRGDSRTINCTFLESDGKTPIDLSGGTVYFTVNSSADPADDTSAAFQLTATDATPFTSPLLGKHTFTLSPTDTDITPATYYYDSQFVDSASGKLSSYRGKFTIIADTTRT
jgi:hypothetical protein